MVLFVVLFVTFCGSTCVSTRVVLLVTEQGDGHCATCRGAGSLAGAGSRGGGQTPGRPRPPQVSDGGAQREPQRRGTFYS